MQKISVYPTMLTDNNYQLAALRLEIGEFSCLVTKGKTLSLAIRGLFLQTRVKSKEELKALDSMRRATISHVYELEEWLEGLASGKISEGEVLEIRL